MIGVRRPSVSPSVCLMSRTSALTRKPKGPGRRNFAQGYPRSHATPTPTPRSKGQKSKSRGQLVHRSEMCQHFANATPFKFGTHIGRGQFLPPDHKLARNWASPAACDPISKFWDPLNISQTGKATIFKLGMHIGRGQFAYHRSHSSYYAIA